jgi:hypothetical protein
VYLHFSDSHDGSIYPWACLPELADRLGCEAQQTRSGADCRTNPPCSSSAAARPGKGHIWTFVGDGRPFGGSVPPVALYLASRDRRHVHPAQYIQHIVVSCRRTPERLEQATQSITPSGTDHRGIVLNPQRSGSSSNWRTSRPILDAARKWRRYH